MNHQVFPSTCFFEPDETLRRFGDTREKHENTPQRTLILSENGTDFNLGDWMDLVNDAVRKLPVKPS
jgi:hypothetical protein